MVKLRGWTLFMFGLDTNPGYDIYTEKITRKSLHIGIYHQVIIEGSHLIEAEKLIV